MRLPDPGRSRVVLIGTSRYEDADLPDLPAVRRSIGDLKAALTDSIYGLVTETCCDVLQDEGDIPLIGRRLRSAASQAEDLLLVYFAGHGLKAGRRHELYLALPSTERNAPEFNALEYDKLRGEVLNSPATTKMIILDCCFSGRAFGDSMADPAGELIGQVEVAGSYVLASAHPNAVALILAGEEHTAFTGRLLRLFHDGVPGGPELLTIDDIYQHLRAKMKAEGLPEPHRRGTDSANLLALARNRAFEKARSAVPAVLEPLPVSIRPSSHGVQQPESPTEPIGLFSNRYRLFHLSGRGGIADLYVARDTMLGRNVAVKVLHHDLASTDVFAKYFFDEATTGAALSDPGISSIYDFGKAELNGVTVRYIAMEYVDGQTLREILQEQGRLDSAQSMAIVDNFLLTLSVIHLHGLLYQEMGPGNIMLTPAGRVKITNGFNLGFINTVNPDNSRFGTSSYWAPDAPDKLDVRSDIYCTGCLLWELLTGQVPFGEDTDAANLFRHHTGEPLAPSAIVPDIPSWCDRIVLKALAKEPDRRYPNSLEMRKEIHAAVSLHRIYE